MPISLYCWRCDMVIPMLDESEWEEIQPAIRRSLIDLMRIRRDLGISLQEALTHGVQTAALQHYERLTGFRETNINAIHHHRASLYGPICTECGKPLRTPRATFCAACGGKPTPQADVP